MVMKSNAKFLVCILLLQLLVLTAMFLDVPVIRQVTGFLFYAFVPGYLIVNLLNIKRKNTTESVLFSLGLSLAFLILLGILFGAVYGIKKR